MVPPSGVVAAGSAFSAVTAGTCLTIVAEEILLSLLGFCFNIIF